jgi:hypothetical protein
VSSEPTTARQLAEALEGGLRTLTAIPPGRNIASADGAYPALDTLRVDLTGAQVDTTRRPAPPGAGETGAVVTARELRIAGRPIQVENARVTLELSATDARLRYARGEGGLWLVPIGVAEGRMVVELARGDLEALILSHAREAGQAHGANVTKLDLKLALLGPRSIAADALVTARKTLLTGTVRLTGQLDIDEALAARISGLDCIGQGVVGSVAAAAIKPKLKRAEGRTMSLGTLVFEGLQPRDVRIESVDPLRIVGTFAGDKRANCD